MTPLLEPGHTVRVRDDWPEAHGPVHLRTPHYLRGVSGRVERYLGSFPNPEDLAFGRTPRPVQLYHVAFEAGAIWPEVAEGGLLVEIYGHWLEPSP